MCGITGALALNHKGIHFDCAKPMADIIAHRGPDDAGYLFWHTGTRHKQPAAFCLNLADEAFRYNAELLPTISSRAAKAELNSHDWDLFLGHRRLAILDVSAMGHQPMSDLTKNVWLVYNGEVYNFRELREELIKCGHSFRTGTDTEVVLYAYIEWGIKCFEKFNGMFAFVLYDNFKKRLILGRDRYGIKPLYYAITGKSGKRTLVFASEVKSILQYQDYEKGIDYEALVEYFTFQNIFTDRTLYKGVKLFPAGHYVEIDLRKTESIGETGKLEVNKYWDFNFKEVSRKRDEREYLEELHSLFEQAVQRQLVSDVEIGSYLSGGMDSGSISCIAARYNTNLKTFTIGFDLSSATGRELSFDERATSEFLSYRYKTEHYEMVLKAGDMERCLPKFAWHLEEPRVGQSYPNFYAAKLAGNFVKVCLSGCGGDELFCGYPWRYYPAIVYKDWNTFKDSYYSSWQRLFRNDEIQEVFSPIFKRISHLDLKDIFLKIFQNISYRPSSPEEFINQCLYFESKTFLNGLLVIEDKLSMAHSLETRVPFLDNDLVDFSLCLPIKYKLGDIKELLKYHTATNVDNPSIKVDTKKGKYLLRKMMLNYVPDNIAFGSKQGFSSPDRSWFREESYEFIKEKIINTETPLYDYLDPEVIKKIIIDHQQGKRNSRLLIWSLINFEKWLKTFAK